MAKESYKEQEKRHVRAMEKAGVSKKIVEEEKKEAGMKKGGMTKKYAMGGLADALNNIGSGMPPSRLSPADRERIAATTMAANARREAMKGASSRMGTAVSPDQSPTSRGVGGGMNVRGFGGQGALSPEQVAALGQAIAPRPAPRPGSGDTPPAPTPPRPTMPPARPGPTPPSTMPIRPPGMKKGGKVEMPKAKDMGKLGMKKGGSVKGDGICQRGIKKAKVY